MSHCIELVDTTASGQEITVHEVNFTYNYSPALTEAGLKWADCDGMAGADLHGKFRRVANIIAFDPERFRPLIRGGGDWGAPEDLISKLLGLSAACERHHASRLERR